MTPPDVGAVIVAAGRGRRLGGFGDERGKALVEVGGRSLLAHAVETLAGIERIGEIVVVHTPGEEEAFRAVTGGAVTLVPGGETRAASVRAGIVALAAPVDLVAVHDAARAFVPRDVVRAVLAAVGDDVIAAAPAVGMVDTVKEVDGDGLVVATLDRDRLRAVQTPQVIRYDVVVELLASGRWEDATDDLAVVEAGVAAGLVEGSVRLIDGDRRGLKLTRPSDIAVIGALTDEEGGR